MAASTSRAMLAASGKTDTDEMNRRVELNPIFGHTSAKQHKEFLKSIKSTSLRRLFTKPKIIIDICCGSNSLAKYYLAKYPDAKVISIDIMPEKQSTETVPTHFRSRLLYENFDIKNFTVEALEEMVRRRCGGTLRDVYGYHFSPECSTYTTADKGRNGFRKDDGSAAHERSELSDDNVRKVMLVLSALSRRYPDRLFTCENPATGSWHLQPIVKQLQDEGWQLTEVHYCAAANPLLDYEHEWPKKPTHILSYGLPDGIELPQCNRSCPFRFGDNTEKSAYHRKAIRIDHNSIDGQTRVEGYLRSAIPRGLFQIFDRAHQYWLCERTDRGISGRQGGPATAKVAMMVCKCCQHFDVNNTVADKNDDTLRHTRLNDMPYVPIG